MGGPFPWVGGDPATGAGSGDVTGPASSTDNALATFDGTGGKTLQNSVIIGDPATGALSGVGTLACAAITSTGILKFSATNTHDIGTSISADAPRSIYAGTNVSANALILASANTLAMGATAGYSGGLDSPDGMYSNAASTLALVGKLADGSANVSVALIADVEAAAITADHVVASMGWANNANAYAALWHLRGDGATVQTGSMTIGGSGSAVVEGGMADGASAIAVTSKSTNALSNATAKLHSWSNAGTEKGYMLHNGLMHSAIGLRVAGDEGTGLAGTRQLTNATAAADTGAPSFIAVPTGVATAQAVWIKEYQGTTVTYIMGWQ